EQRPDFLADWHGFADYLFSARRCELHRDYHPAPRPGNDLDADAVLLLGAVRDRVSAVARVPSARSGRHHAVDGQGGPHQLLPADWPGCWRRAGEYQRRRQSVALATSVLVPRAS